MPLVRPVLLALAILGFLAAGPILSQSRPGQPVTYSDFDYVQAVTSSMSYVYFATTGGVIKYDKMRRRWEEPLTGGEGYPSEEVREIRVDRFDQTLILVTDIGLYEYDDFFYRWYPIQELPKLENDIRHIASPDVLMPEFNANYMGEGQFIDYASRSFFAVDIVDDRSGDLWIGTWGYGPAVASSASGQMTLLPYGLLQERVDCLLRDDSVLWTAGASMGAFRSGLTAFNTDENRFFRLESGISMDLPAEDIYALEADPERLYAGTPYGLYLIDRETWGATGPTDRRNGLADNFVLALEIMNDNLYVGTTAGLSRVDLVTDSIYQIRSETFSEHIVYDLERIDSTLWIASDVGAFRYTPSSERLQQFQDEELVLFGAVLEIEPFEDEVWFTSDAGAVCLNRLTGESKSYRQPSALTDRRALAVNHYIVALADDYGMTLIIRGDEKDSFLSFDDRDGLPSRNILALLIEGEYLWVGTDRGLTRFVWDDPLIID